jgi:hypothetical protein
MSIDVNAPLREYAESVHSYARAIPSAIDTKVAVFAAALVGTLIFGLDQFADREPDAKVDREYWFLAVGSIMIVVALALSIGSLLARMKGSTHYLFSVVALAARSDADSVVGELKNLSPEQLIENQLRHCYELAQISVVKTRLFNAAAYVGLIGLVLVAIGVLV